MLNDAGTVRPEGGRAFNDMIADATTRALDITYAKAPDIGVFRSTSQFIVRNGLTAVLPFHVLCLIVWNLWVSIWAVLQYH